LYDRSKTVCGQPELLRRCGKIEVVFLTQRDTLWLQREAKAVKIMHDKKRTMNGKGQKPPSFTAFIHHEEDRVEGKRRFTDPVEANNYFKELCGSRTASPG
jgi:hypothetical protein